MDYTTVNRVKAEMHVQSETSVDDTLLLQCVQAASKMFDRMCTGVPDSSDYFLLEDIESERLTGLIDYSGQRIICYPHKPVITSVTAFSYQKTIIDTLYAVDVARVEAVGPRVDAYPSSLPDEYPINCRVTISYRGGLAETTAELPEDLQEAVSTLAVRLYREAETGLGDQIGVAELSTLVYTKSLPVRVGHILEYYRRKVGWRHVA